MARQGIKTDGASTAGGARGWMARAGAATLVLGLTACSSLPDIPDYANPVEWYNSSTEMVGGWFEDEKPKIETASAAKTVGEKAKKGDEKFPSLSSVPAKPEASGDADARAKLKNQLSADRANARYTDEKTKATSKAAPPPKPSVKPAVEKAVETAGKVTAPKPAAVPAAPSASAAQLARLPSSVYRGKRSSLWPNAPAPGPSSEAATTSARVGRPVVSSSGQTSNISSTLSAIPRPRAAQSDRMASDNMAKDAAAKDTMSGVTPIQTAAAPVAPPAPEIPPRFTLTPPSASTDGAATTETAAGATTPTFQLTPPSGMSTSTDGDGGQPMLRFNTFDEGGAAGIVTFGHGSSRLSSADRAKLRALADEALNQGLYVRVVGHASMRTRDMDPFEHTLANFNVSLMRANVVAGALLEMGVPAEQLIIDAVGDTQPLFSEAMPSGEQGNRRAEIYLES